MKTKSIYTRRLASGHEATWYSRSHCQLWLGPDHLLHGRKSYITEQYRRLFFKDIQAITLAPTDRWKTHNIASVLLIAGCLAIILLATSDWPLRLIWGIVMCTVPALFLAYNLAKGPTCACYFHTAVQREQIGAISRLKKARKVLALLAPILEEAQGPLDPAKVESAQASAAHITLARGDSKRERWFHPSDARYHLYFFLFVLAAGLNACLNLEWAHLPKEILVGLVYLLAVVFGVAAVLNQRRSLIHLELQNITLTALVLMIGETLVSTVLSMTYTVSVVVTSDGRPAEFRDWEFFPYYALLCAVLHIAMSLLGLLRLHRYRVSLLPPEFASPMTAGPAS